jgi:peroxiredoxin
MNSTAIDAYGLGKEYDIGGVKLKSARRATILIDKQGKIVEESIDNDAVDPSKIVAACARTKLHE